MLSSSDWPFRPHQLMIGPSRDDCISSAMLQAQRLCGVRIDVRPHPRALNFLQSENPDFAPHSGLLSASDERYSSCTTSFRI